MAPTAVAPSHTQASSPQRKPWWSHLYVQVLIAIALGVALGYLRPDLAGSDLTKALGDGFIKLIRMIIAPIIFCTVVSGIAGMESMKKVGRVGLTAIVYFEIVTTIALLVGLVVINVVQPGVGANIDPRTIDPSKIAAFTAAAHDTTTVGFLMSVIPESFVGAFAKGDILPVLLIAVMFGFALFRLGEPGKPVLDMIDRVGKVIFGIVGIIMRAAPVGAFGAMAYVVAKFGIGSLWYPIYLLIVFYVTSILFVLVIFGLIGRWAGFSIIAFVRYIKEELLLVLGTSSSESALPRLMAKLENLGCEKSVVGLVVPILQSRRHDDLPRPRLDLRGAGHEHPPHLDRPARHHGGPDPLLERGGRRDGRRLHHPRRNIVGDPDHPGRRHHHDPGRRQVHIGMPGAHQSHRQRRRHDRGFEMGRRPRRSTHAACPLGGDVGRSGLAGGPRRLGFDAEGKSRVITTD